MNRLPFAAACGFLLAIIATPSALASYPADEVQTLIGTGIINNGLMGSATAVRGNVAVVGAPADSNSVTKTGTVYVFERLDGSTWTERPRLTPAGGQFDDQFGAALALGNGVLAVGAPGDDTQAISAGAVYIYEDDGSGWQQTQKLTVSNAGEGDAFGASLSMSGSVLLVGAPLKGAGAAYVFRKSGASWVFSQQLGPSVPDSGDSFGGALAVDGSVAAIGAWGDDDRGQDGGALYIYVDNGSTFGVTQKVYGADTTVGDNFGFALDVSGQQILVGAPNAGLRGAAYVFDRPGASWTQVQKLTDLQGSDFDGFGRAVAISGTTAVVGAPFDDDATVGPDVGSASSFVLEGSTWVLGKKMLHREATDNDQFGFSVAAEASTAIIGAPLYFFEGTAGRAGAAVAFGGPPLGELPDVSDFLALAAGGEVFLTWTNPSEQTFAGVKILRRTDRFPSGPNDTGALVVADTLAETHRDGGLTNGQTYYYAAFAHDGAGTYSGGTFTSAQPQAFLFDDGPPKITRSPEVLANATTAMVLFETHEPAKGSVDYGVAGSLNSTITNAGYRTTHLVHIPGLTPSTTYDFRVCGTDALNQLTCSLVDSFTTAPTPTSEPPAIVAGPSVTSLSADRIRVAFESNVPVTFDLLVYELAARSPLRRRAALGYGLTHTAELSQLAAATTYEYAVELTSPDGTTSLTPRYRFTTPASPDQEGPLLAAAPMVSNLSDRSATVTVSFDEPARIEIQYGPPGSFTGRTIKTEPAQEFALRLPGLDPSTTYDYIVYAYDVHGNGPSLSEVYQFTTLAAPDTTPPSLDWGPEIDTLTIGDGGAHLAFRALEPVRARLLYGLTASYGRVVLSDVLQERHGIEVPNLDPGTTYHYALVLTDGAGNVWQSSDSTFTTAAAPRTEPPLFLMGPRIRWRTTKAMLVEWETDVPTEVELSLVPGGSGRADMVPLRHSGRPGARRQGEALIRFDLGTARAADYEVAGSFCDPTGTCMSAPGVPVNTPTETDTTAPVITHTAIVYLSDDQALANWQTNEPASAELRWQAGGVTRSLAVPSVRDEHTVRLVGLPAGATVSWTLRVADAAGNVSAASGGPPFTTPPAPDTTWPTLSSINVAPDETRATVLWKTDERADSIVEYGPGGLSRRRSKATFHGNHRIVLTRLSPGTTYVYRVGSSDPRGNGVRWSTTRSFTTRGEPVPLTSAPWLVLAVVAMSCCVRRRP